MCDGDTWDRKIGGKNDEKIKEKKRGVVKRREKKKERIVHACKNK